MVSVSVHFLKDLQCCSDLSHLCVTWWSVWDLGRSLAINSVLKVFAMLIKAIGDQEVLNNFMGIFPKPFPLWFLFSTFWPSEFPFLITQQFKLVPSMIVSGLGPRDRTTEREKKTSNKVWPLLLESGLQWMKRKVPLSYSFGFCLLLLPGTVVVMAAAMGSPEREKREKEKFPTLSEI